MADAVPAALALVGVFVGALMTSWAADRKWIRELKVTRYNRLIHLVEDGERALIAYVDVASRPRDHADSQPFSEALDASCRGVDAATNALTDAASELAVYAHRGVRVVTVQVMDTWRKTALEARPPGRRFGEESDAASPGQDADETWPNEELVARAAELTAKRGEIDRVLGARKRELVSRIRMDLGVDAIPPWRRVAWWRADRRAMADFARRDRTAAV